MLNDDVQEDEVRAMPQVEVDLGILFLSLLPLPGLSWAELGVSPGKECWIP